MKTKLIVITLLVTVLTADFFQSLHSRVFNQWLVTVIYIVVLVISAFFEKRWLSKQADPLKARYRATNASMWIYLLLAAICAAPNFFISTAIDKTVLWPVILISTVLFGMTLPRRQELLRQLVEKQENAANSI